MPAYIYVVICGYVCVCAVSVEGHADVCVCTYTCVCVAWMTCEFGCWVIGLNVLLAF